MSVTIDDHVNPAGITCVNRLIALGRLSSVHYQRETASTNSDAITDLRRGALADDLLPKLYLADLQTAGRGRHGRTWISGDDALTFSLLINQSPDNNMTAADPTHVNLLPIAVAIAIARSIEFSFAPLQTRLKWPNDVYIDGGKVAGVLLETTQQDPHRVVLGIGINVNQAPSLPAVPPDSATHAIASQSITPKSIANSIGRPVDRYDVLETVIDQILETLSELVDQPGQIVTAFRQRCLLTGHEVQFVKTGQPDQGTCLGITDAGALSIQTASEVVHCVSGEVNQVRRR
ncbi:MAG: biotin--[acetyl-CoA-carboxylase] ligase [Pirellulaceae bacterium]|nr:biotin--[acetyl-CoA-carboxylase] ligase [Pirellulaceae bacterium]